MTKIFYDSEFTGLTQNTQLISIGLVDEAGASFYAEFSTIDPAKCDPWIVANVLNHCRYIGKQSATLASAPLVEKTGTATQAFGTPGEITKELSQWLANYHSIEIWADCLAYDWVLLCELFGGALNLPKHIHYMPGDLSTLFRLKGLDPDTNREDYAGITNTAEIEKHNALWDAKVCKKCYQKLMNT